MNELDLFAAAVAVADSDQREALLNRECAGRPDLQSRINQLLDAHFKSHPLLDQPALEGGGAPPIDCTPLEVARAVIGGKYKLLEQVGEGGFGVVFMAEQQQPVRRKVAIKLLKPGMDTRQVVARFEAERQALAMMDHPNIAHVFDGGTTSTGRPYFVMELVCGVPITEFCDQSCLTIRQRLELFVDVCQAVQHAHQKGIIHRDIKPTNVMVTLHDGQPVVKVIDFGIAKAMGQQLTEKTLFTNFAQLIGTPLYMSPEQAEMSGLDVDTRSDIYALGVLLYELLTGTTPFENERLSKVGYDEMRRIIREEEPPKPSMRVSTVGKLATTASQKRQGDPRKLSRLFRGELDWIVMKALEKDRNRRYETANAFALDVRGYLNDEQVVACPPSAAYRLSKFARRHRTALSLAAAFTMLLATATAVTGRMASRAMLAEQAMGRERDRAEAAAKRAQENFEIAKNALAGLLGDLPKYDEAETALRGALDIWKKLATDFPAVPEYREYLAATHRSLGHIHACNGQWKQAAADFDRSLELDAANHECWTYVASLRAATDDLDGYRRTCAQMVEQFGDATAATAERTAKACLLLPDALSADDFERVQRLAQRAVTGTESSGYYGLFAMAESLADYRAARYAEAIKWMHIAPPHADGTHWDATKFAVLAMAHHALEHEQEASAALANSQAIVAKAPDPSTGVLLGADNWLDWLHAQVLCREAEDLLDIPATERVLQPAVTLAHYHIRLSQWDEAAAEYAQAGLLERPLRADAYSYACLFLIRGDHEGYNRFCQDMIQRAAETQDPSEACVLARSCAMARESAADPARVVQWAKQALASFYTPWRAHVLGLAQYRAGRINEALQSFTSSNGGATWGYRDLNWFGLALVHHHLGHHDEARRCLDKGIEWLRKRGPPSPDRPAYFQPQDWIEAQLLRREAEAVLKKDP